jgi:hypothetical protein
LKAAGCTSSPIRSSRRVRRAENPGTWKPGNLTPPPAAQDARTPGCQVFIFHGVRGQTRRGRRAGPPAFPRTPGPPRTRSGREGRARGAGMAAPMGAPRASPAARGSRVQIGLARLLMSARPSGSAARSLQSAIVLIYNLVLAKGSYNSRVPLPRGRRSPAAGRQRRRDRHHARPQARPDVRDRTARHDLLGAAGRL